MMQLIFTAIGGQEVLIRKRQQQAGKGKATVWDKGYMFLYPFEPVNPYRHAYEMMGDGWIDKGQKPDKSVGEFGIAEAERRANKSGSWLYNAKDKIRRILERNGEKGLKEWFNFTDRIREMEREHGLGFKARHLPKSTQTSARMEAVRKMSEGWMQEPYNSKRWGEKPTEDKLQFWFDNFKDFQPRRRRLS
jgi:hypothetical protein